jgi:hydrogenase maturation protease
MTDDGVGTRIAKALKDRLSEYDITVLIGETDFGYCFDEIHPDDFLIIIDAIAELNKPGSIEIIPIKDALNSRFKLQAQHDFSLFDAVLLNYPDIKGFLIGIEAAEIGFGFDLSPTLKIVFDKLCNDVLDIILKFKEAAKRA